MKQKIDINDSVGRTVLRVDEVYKSRIIQFTDNTYSALSGYYFDDEGYDIDCYVRDGDLADRNSRYEQHQYATIGLMNQEELEALEKTWSLQDMETEKQRVSREHGEYIRLKKKYEGKGLV